MCHVSVSTSWPKGQHDGPYTNSFTCTKRLAVDPGVRSIPWLKDAHHPALSAPLANF